MYYENQIVINVYLNFNLFKEEENDADIKKVFSQKHYWRFYRNITTIRLKRSSNSFSSREPKSKT